ncbi:LamG domain-containing protein [Spirillospora sp. CA-294931]|uniref:LamG domain-containing protein n=1 Tax=Spirillospora sp. CA-294931 TaxID=3240042 RepID=UPI003D8F7658
MLDQQLIAHWAFGIEDVHGHTVTDAAGSLTAELDRTVGIVPGRTGEALSFDGRGIAAIPAARQLVLDQMFGFSLTFMINVTASPTGEWRGLFFKQVAEHDARSVGLWLYPDAMRLRAQLFTVKGPEFADTRGRLPLGDWIHVALVVDTDGMFLYIDGKPNVAVPLEHAVVSAAGPLYLGAEPGHAGFSGLLDDFRVYGSALDGEDVLILAESRPAP